MLDERFDLDVVDCGMRRRRRCESGDAPSPPLLVVGVDFEGRFPACSVRLFMYLAMPEGRVVLGCER